MKWILSRYDDQHNIVDELEEKVLHVHISKPSQEDMFDKVIDEEPVSITRYPLKHPNDLD